METSDTTNSTIFVEDDTMNSTSGDMGNEGRNSKIILIMLADIIQLSFPKFKSYMVKRNLKPVKLGILSRQEPAF